MEVTLKRAKMPYDKTYTIGHLYIDDVYYCDTIEDKDRGLTQSMPLDEIKKRKVKSQTAIPRGRYRITLNVISPKFYKKTYYKRFCNGKLPRLIDVPGFEGILMHKGLNENSSAGCIILGLNKIKGCVIKSQECFEKVYNKLKTAKDNNDEIWITIE